MITCINSSGILKLIYLILILYSNKVRFATYGVTKILTDSGLQNEIKIGKTALFRVKQNELQNWIMQSSNTNVVPCQDDTIISESLL